MLNRLRTQATFSLVKLHPQVKELSKALPVRAKILSVRAQKSTSVSLREQSAVSGLSLIHYINI